MCVMQRSKVLYIDRVYRVSPDASLYTLYIATHDNASSAHGSAVPPPARFALYSMYLADISLAIVCSWMLDVPS